ncbi:MAG: hypothetical protein K6T90_01240 [Leptolyngbyaceae cyanobacterium HOT.MB2.61]|jgi:hypothetical protein|nr:hypothetical protein [Leptolyngbyaceae cyanobacterium HOT.MB2.61]
MAGCCFCKDSGPVVAGFSGKGSVLDDNAALLFNGDTSYAGQFSAFLSIVLRIGLGLRLAVSWFTAVYVAG